MVSINDFMEQNEKVLKKSGLGGIDLISGPKGRGDLYLTDKRIVFIPRKRYNFPFVNRMRNEALEFLLENIDTVRLYDQKLQITVDDTYTFAFIGANKWVEEIKEAKESSTPTIHTPQVIQQPRPKDPQKKARFCPYCGEPLSFIEQYQRHYCYSCERYI